MNMVLFQVAASQSVIIKFLDSFPANRLEELDISGNFLIAIPKKSKKSKSPFKEVKSAIEVKKRKDKTIYMLNCSY